MNEIKTVDERLKGIDFSGNRIDVSTEEFVALKDEVSELHAACEALRKENETLVTSVELLNTQILCLQAIADKKSKRIAELEDK